ncbi:hypothetical protein M8668_13680 [Clostridioides difficile]|nr:hypothetical protein [Clostridioides difficile]
MYYLGTGIVTKHEDEWDNRWRNEKIIGDGLIVVHVNAFIERHYGINLCYDLVKKGIDVRKTIPKFVEDLGNQFNISSRVIELLEETEKLQNMYSSADQKRRMILIELKIN